MICLLQNFLNNNYRICNSQWKPLLIKSLIHCTLTKPNFEIHAHAGDSILEAIEMGTVLVMKNITDGIFCYAYVILKLFKKYKFKNL